MNPLPFLGLAAIASIYFAASDRLDARFAVLPQPEIMAYGAGGDASVYDMMSGDAQAMDQPHCEPDTTMAQNLSHDFAEEPVQVRTTGEGLEMELWASDLMGTWTVVHRGNDGISCIVSSGIGWTDATTPAKVFETALGLPVPAYGADSPAS